MTVRERMLAVYRGERPDRLPVSIYKRYLPTGATERLARNLGLGISDYFPPVSLLTPPWHLAEGYVSEVRGAELQVRFHWEHDQRVETRRYETPVGAVWQETVQDPHYGSDWIRKHYITGRDDYRVVQYLVEHTVFRRNTAGLAARRRDLGDDGVVFGRLDRSPYQKVLLELAGPERFLEDFLIDPAPVAELLDAIHRRLAESFAMAAESDVEVFWQPDNISADMTPPAAFARYCQPFYDERAHAVAQPYVVHMDGRLKPIQAAVAASALDVVESFSLPQVGNDLTLAEAWAAWPDKVILPNFPAPLCRESSAGITSFVEALLTQVGAARPFMLQFSEDIPTAEWSRVVPLVSELFQRRTTPG